MSTSDEYVVSGFTLMAGPQLVVIGLVLVFPPLRNQFGTLALVSLSILLLAFRWIVSSDQNGGVLWMFYFPGSAIIVFIAWLMPKRRVRKGCAPGTR